MQTPEDFISHAIQRTYDPVKAHAYYLRTRHLKGRRKMAKITTTNVRKKGKLTGDLAVEDTTNRVDNQGRLIKPAPVLISVKRQAEVQARVTELRGKLKLLHAILNKLVKDAQGTTRKTSKSGATKTTSADSKKRKALTSAQKNEKAKKARTKYRKEHPTSERAARQQKIEQVRQQIEQVQSQLKEALDRARKLSTQNQPAAMSRRNSKKG